VANLLLVFMVSSLLGSRLDQAMAEE
jgi:hypothetical protein